MTTRPRRVSGVALLVSLALISACTSGDSPRDRGEGATTTTATAATGNGAARPVSEDQLVEGLAAAGVGTYETTASRTPVRPVDGSRPLRVLRWQAANLAREASAGGGYAGVELDRLAPMPQGAPPLSYLLAAYVQGAQTPGASFSRTLMGDRPWGQAPALVFPTAVVLLFTSDVAGPTAQSPTATGAGVPTDAEPTARLLSVAAAGRQPTGLCSSLSDWISQTISDLLDALKADTSGGGIGGLLGTIWNGAVTLAQVAIQGLVTAVTAPLLAAIKAALGAVGALTVAASLLHPASVSVTGVPDPVAFGVDPNPGNDATFTATVTTGASEWPADLVDCAAQVGLTLPDPTAIAGSPVTWKTTGLPPLGNRLAADDALDQQGRARLSFRTGTESQDQASRGALLTDPVTANVTADRTDVKQLQDLLQTLLLGVLPGPLGELAQQLLGQLIAPVLDELAALVAAIGSGATTVVHHGPPPRAGDTGTTVCQGSGTGTIPDGTWTGPITTDVSGQSAPVSGAIQSTGGGTLTMTIDKGQVTSGTFSLSFQSSGTVETQGGRGTIQSLSVVIPDGVVTGPATAPVISGTGTMSGSIQVDAAGYSVTVPINEVHPGTATMTVQQADCAEVVATFIPSFNQTGGGVASFTGTATWTGSRA